MYALSNSKNSSSFLYDYDAEDPYELIVQPTEDPLLTCITLIDEDDYTNDDDDDDDVCIIEERVCLAENTRFINNSPIISDAVYNSYNTVSTVKDGRNASAGKLGISQTGNIKKSTKPVRKEPNKKETKLEKKQITKNVYPGANISRTKAYDKDPSKLVSDVYVNSSSNENSTSTRIKRKSVERVKKLNTSNTKQPLLKCMDFKSDTDGGCSLALNNCKSVVKSEKEIKNPQNLAEINQQLDPTKKYLNSFNLTSRTESTEDVSTRNLKHALANGMEPDSDDAVSKLSLFVSDRIAKCNKEKKPPKMPPEKGLQDSNIKCLNGLIPVVKIVKYCPESSSSSNLQKTIKVKNTSFNSCDKTLSNSQSVNDVNELHGSVNVRNSKKGSGSEPIANKQVSDILLLAWQIEIEKQEELRSKPQPQLKKKRRIQTCDCKFVYKTICDDDRCCDTKKRVNHFARFACCKIRKAILGPIYYVPVNCLPDPKQTNCKRRRKDESNDLKNANKHVDYLGDNGTNDLTQVNSFDLIGLELVKTSNELINYDNGCS